MIICHLNFGNQAPYLYLCAIHILHLFVTAEFTLMLLFLKLLYFCFPLIYQTAFLLDDCSGLVKLPHQFHSKLKLCSSSNSIFSASFLSFSMVWLLSSKLFWKSYFIRLAPYCFGVQLASSCTSLRSCSFCSGYI